MARFFVPRKNLHDNRGLIDGQELDHLKKALRLGPGDRITVFDDGGWEHDAVIRELSVKQGEIEILRSYRAGRESPLRLILAVGLTKGEKIDWVIEKATELGAHKIVPFTSIFAVPRLDEKKIAARASRWEKIALSAVKQCGRTQLPEISPLCAFDDLVTGTWPETLKLLFWEKEAERSLHEVHAKLASAKSVLLAVGPEGGFAAQEVEAAQAQGFETVGLGRRTLRAETAAITALGLVQFLWGDLK
ncbi:MAG: 16S rRNA (uracil(1498)-N(3))-methyltransferase [Chloroflexota bacterium]